VAGSKAAVRLRPRRRRQRGGKALPFQVVGDGEPLQMPAPNKSLVPLPTRLKTIMRYSDSYQLTTGATGIVGATQRMRLNSIFDPDLTGTGHQPYGFDQVFGVFYRKYWVSHAKATMLATTVGGSAEVMIAFQVAADGFLTLAGVTPTFVAEQSAVCTFPLSASGNSRTRAISVTTDMARLFGVPAKQYRDSESLYAALYTANPVQGAFLEVGAYSPSGVGAEAFNLQIVVEYTIEAFEPATLSHS